MGKRRKKFIDKRSAITFHLVHRSQHDPLVVDESAPSRVLAEAPRKSARKEDEGFQKRKEEERKYGIYFDDDYDYLQHLKSLDEFTAELEPVERFRVDRPYDRKGGRTLNLPSSVFESSVQEKVGVLNKAAPVSGPQLDVDPDIAAALDGDFDFDNPDNELEDDFVAIANAEVEGNEEESPDSDELKDEVFDELEAGSRVLTNYSLTSSVIRRNAGLKLIDAHFERIVEGEYDDSEIGALDDEEIDGKINPNSEMLLQMAREFKATRATGNLPPLAVFADAGGSEEEEMVEMVRERMDTFDCQSILSTRANQSQYAPKIIREPKPIKINRKTGIPEGVLGSALTAENVLRLQSSAENKRKEESDVGDGVSLISRISELSVRPKWETPEERRTRKHAVKELRRERRVEKKANAEAFKREKQLQVTAALNLRMNCSGKRLV